jgi:uncharacterized protein
MSNKRQIVFIHGGGSFDSNEEFYAALRTWTYDPYQVERKRWRDSIATALVDTHEFMVPAMPNKQNADYIAWSIWFEKVVPYLRDGAVLIGHSLGGGFLLRYLTENNLPVRISQLHLVAPVVDAIDCPGVGDFVIDVATWSHFASRIEAVHLWHSSDDTLVPMHHSERFKAVYPEAVLHTFTDRGHLLQSEFPELLSVIQA